MQPLEESKLDMDAPISARVGYQSETAHQTTQEVQQMIIQNNRYLVILSYLCIYMCVSFSVFN